MISFEHRLARILEAEHFPINAVREGLSPRSKESLHIAFDEETNFLTITDVNTDKKTKGKPAAMLRRLLYPMVAEVIPDTTFENIANKIKAVAELSKGSIELWDAERIPEAYLEENYVPDYEVNTGTLYSCMRYDWAQKFMSWYKSIGKGLVQIAVLVRKSDQKILGRALVWNLPDGRIFMDRAYGSDSTRQLFRDHAQENGWWKRYYDSFDYKSHWINPETNSPEDVKMEIEVARKKRILRNVPYMDTFSYLDLSEGIIHNSSRGKNIDVYLEVTRGLVEHNYDRMTGVYGFHHNDVKAEAEEFFVNFGKDGHQEVDLTEPQRYFDTLDEDTQRLLDAYMALHYSNLHRSGYPFTDEDWRLAHRDMVSEEQAQFRWNTASTSGSTTEWV